MNQQEDIDLTFSTQYEQQLAMDDFTSEGQEKIQEYICPLCHGIYVDPIIDSCAHIFCKKCFMHYLGNESNKKCPIGQNIVDKVKIKEFEFITEIIKRQNAYCINKTKGCNWVDSYAERPDHVELHCEYQQINCSNDGCNMIINRRDLAIHNEVCLFKLSLCMKCNQEIVRGLLMNHRSECPKEELICVCEQVYFRDMIDKHKRDECPMTKINCQYSIYGCQENFIRSEQQNHNNQLIEKHNQLVLKWINEIKNQFDQSYEKQYEELKEKQVKVSGILGQLINKCKQLNINLNNFLLPK